MGIFSSVSISLERIFRSCETAISIPSPHGNTGGEGMFGLLLRVLLRVLRAARVDLALSMMTLALPMNVA